MILLLKILFFIVLNITPGDMIFKYDTKEKLVVFRLEEPAFNANLAEDFIRAIHNLKDLDGRSLVLDMADVQSIDHPGIEAILAVYQEIYAKNLSCCLANLNSALTAQVNDAAGDQFINIVPTVSEAMDIVMMEEIERELGLDIDEGM